MVQKVVGIGEVLWDVFPTGKKIGGAPANFAYHVAQLGLNGVVVSSIGEDILGDKIINDFEKKQLKYHLERTVFSTGTVEVLVNDQGIPRYIIKDNVAWDNIHYTPELKKLAEQTSCVCFGSLAQRNQVSRSTILSFLDNMRQDTYKVFDVNLRQKFYTKEILNQSFEKCNILKINTEELNIISNLHNVTGGFEEQCNKLLSLYECQLIILTCGENGSWLFTPTKSLFRKTPKVEVVDTVGAGDSFTAALMASILKGYTLEDAHRIAVDISAYVCTQPGAMPKLPLNLMI